MLASLPFGSICPDYLGIPGLCSSRQGGRDVLAFHAPPARLRGRRRKQRGGERAGVAPLRGGGRAADGASPSRNRALRVGGRSRPPPPERGVDRRRARRRGCEGAGGRGAGRTVRDGLLLL